MSVDLPRTENGSARELAVWVSELELERAIAYLELVRTRRITPGPEIERLFGSVNEDGKPTLLSWTMEEVVAVQNKLALALCIKQHKISKRNDYFQLSKQINSSVFRHRVEVLRSYNYRGNNGNHIRRHTRVD